MISICSSIANLDSYLEGWTEEELELLSGHLYSEEETEEEEVEA